MRLVARPAVVVWRDACSFSGWRSADEAASKETIEVTSFGVIVRRTKKHVVVAHGVSEDGEYLGLTTIPSPWVVKVLYPRLGMRRPRKGTRGARRG